MQRRLSMAVTMTVLLVAALAPGGAAAKSPTPNARDGGIKVGDIKYVPKSLDQKRPVVVMVKLAGAPVAVAQGAALDASPSRKLSPASKAQIRGKIKAQHRAITPRITSLGGKVLANFTDVMNGLRVRVPQGKLPALKRLAGVVKVEAARVYTRGNENSDKFIGADKAWSANQGYAGYTGYNGAGVRVAIIDTGIDYYHANFGGSGDPEDFDCDDGLDRSGNNAEECVAARGLDTFPTNKVVEGWDLAGDCYHADEDPTDPTPPFDQCPGGLSDIPTPDNDPLDCHGHGTHVAGTAAGFGVVDGGSPARYIGPYNTTTLAANDFLIAPGVAPRAKLLAYRVFGCEGSTYLVVDALERAVQDGADVVNMSLGSVFGRDDDFDAEATNNTSLAGTTVVASAGNSAQSAYITGAPGAATRAISVAALDALPEFPGVSVDVSVGADLSGINMNNSPDLPVTGTIAVIEDRAPSPASCVNPGAPADYLACEQLGCEASDYTGDLNFQAGDIAAIRRGGCAFVDKGAAAEAAGASAVIVVNRVDVPGLPVFIGYNPEIFDIPMIGLVREDQAALEANDEMSATLTDAGSQPNPTYKFIASFSSGGPRNGDSAIKPDVIAPGVAVLSSLVGGGTQGTTLQGTSMAAPAVAGVAALVAQAHPGWRPTRIKAAIVGTSNSNLVQSPQYDVRRAGAGVVQPRRAVDTQAVITTTSGNSNLDFNYQQIGGAQTIARKFQIWNVGDAPRTYNLTAAFNKSPLGFTMSVTPSSVTLSPGEKQPLTAKLSITAAAAAALPNSEVNNAFIYHPLTVVRGNVVATPTTTGPGVYTVRSPFLIAPRALSGVQPGQKTAYTVDGDEAESSVSVSNSGVHAGDADVFAWGLSDRNETYDEMDLRAVGVQSFECDVADGCAVDGDRFMVFAINTWTPWSNQTTNEFDILIDTEPCPITRGAPICEDADPEYALVAVDWGLVSAGSFDGTMVTLLYQNIGGTFFLVAIEGFNRLFPNSTTLFVPVVASDMGLGPQQNAGGEDHDFNYTVQSFSFVPGVAEDEIDRPDLQGPAWAAFNGWEQPVSTGGYEILDPAESVNMPMNVDLDSYWDDPQAGASRVKGWMVVSTDDRNGSGQADLVSIGSVPQPVPE